MWSLYVWNEHFRVIEDVVPHSLIEAGVLCRPPKVFLWEKALSKNIPSIDKTECMAYEYTTQDEEIKEKEKESNEIECLEVGIDLQSFHADTNLKRFGNNNTLH